MKYLKPFQSFNLLQEKTLSPISPEDLIPDGDSKKQIQLKTNQEIINSFPITFNFKGKEKQVQLPKELSNPNQPNFLSQVSTFLSNQGITPYLNINTNDQGRDESVSLGVSWTIPKTDISVNLQNGYFGLDIPLPKGINLGLGYQPGTKEDIVGGWKNKIGGNQFTNSKIGATLTIPIGKP